MSDIPAAISPGSRPCEVRYDRGTHWRARLGFIVIPTDLVMEENIARLAPEGVGTYVSRVSGLNDCNLANLAAQAQGLAEAASTLMPAAPPHVIAYACTSGSIVIGEERCVGEIERGCPGTRATTLISGVLRALETLGARRIVVATPYLDEINALEAEFLAARGFEVLDIQGMNVEDGVDMGRIEPEFIAEYALAVDRADADAIFVSCGGIRTLDVVEEIERAAGKPVVCSNQAMMWHCLRLAGIEDRIEGYGELMRNA